MKKILSLLLLMTAFSKVEIHAQRTEEYAIVDVFELRKKKIIRITEGEQTPQEKQWEKEKTDVAWDFSPVMKALHELNAKGFELVNMTSTYTTIDGHTIALEGTPRMTFILRRKM